MQGLEALTTAPVWMLPPAFLDAGFESDDTVVAQRLQDEYVHAHTDPRVTGLYAFLWCCDDTVTGNKQFYVAGGGHMPATLSALRAIGRAIVAR